MVQDLLAWWKMELSRGWTWAVPVSVLVIYVFLEKDGEMAAGMRRLDC